MKMANVWEDGPQYEEFLGLWRIFGSRLSLEMKYFQEWNWWQEGWLRYVEELKEKNGSSEEV